MRWSSPSVKPSCLCHRLLCPAVGCGASIAPLVGRERGVKQSRECYLRDAGLSASGVSRSSPHEINPPSCCRWLSPSAFCVLVTPSLQVQRCSSLISEMPSQTFRLLRRAEQVSHVLIIVRYCPNRPPSSTPILQCNSCSSKFRTGFRPAGFTKCCVIHWRDAGIDPREAVSGPEPDTQLLRFAPSVAPTG